MLRDSRPVEKYIPLKENDFLKLIDEMNEYSKKGFVAHGPIFEQKGIYFQLMVTTIRGK
jgi:hypothetical protein